MGTRRCLSEPIPKGLPLFHPAECPNSKARVSGETRADYAFAGCQAFESHLMSRVPW